MGKYLSAKTERWIKSVAIDEEFAVEILPPVAEEILKANVTNYRKALKAYIAQYGRAMADGDWDLNGSTISFWPDGRLADGQNRLMACVVSGKPFRTLIYWGVESDRNIDSGSKRQFKLELIKRGEANAVILAATVRGIYRYKHTGVLLHGGGFNPGNAELLRFLDENPALRDSTKQGCSSGMHRFGGPSHYALMHYLMSVKDLAKADSFLSEAMTEEDGNPAVTLRRHLTNKVIHRPGALYIRGCLIYAANAYMEDRLLKRITFKVFGRGDFPVLSFVSPEDI